MRVFNKKSTKIKRLDLRKRCTKAENLLWAQLRRKQILGCKFYRQFGIGEYIADFYCPLKKIIVEVDGEYHNTIETSEYDVIRDNYLNEFDIKIIHVSNQDIYYKLDDVLQIIEAEIMKRPPRFLTSKV